MVIALTPRRQRMADANIAVAFPELSPRERRGIARRSVYGISRTMMELLALPRISKADLERLIETPDLSPVRQAAQSGSGVLFLTAHFGNWEWLGAHLEHQVAPLAVVALDHRHGGVADIINAARASHGVRMLGRDDTREMLRILGSGGMLGMLPDQHSPSGGIRMDFLGQPAWTHTGPAVLAARTGARVFMVLCLRERSGALRMELLPELRFMDTGERKEDVAANTRLINDALEQAIREHPDNWLWLHDRWKEQRAPGEKR